jgi:hypothetical protein
MFVLLEQVELQVNMHVVLFFLGDMSIFSYTLLGWHCLVQTNIILAFSEYINHLFRKTVLPNESNLNCLRKCS